MFPYLRNYSSNAHQVCCEDSPTMYDHCQSDDLGLHSRSQVHLKPDLVFNLQYLGQYLSYYIQTWYDGTLMDAGGDSLVERRTRDPKTRGSNPIRSTRKICDSFSESKWKPPCVLTLCRCVQPHCVYARIRMIAYAR